MSLGVTVGAVAMYSSSDSEGEAFARAQLAGIREVLVEADLPPHDEPEPLPPLDWGGALRSLRYADVQALQHVAAAVDLGGNLANASTYGAGWVGTAALIGTNHLVAHSSTHGWYVPVEFQRVLVDPQTPSRFDGGYLGSSQRLLAALRACASALEIELNAKGGLTAAGRSRVESPPPDHRQRGVFEAWNTLWRAGHLSVESGAAILFH